ncbi:MAG: hypothetical protein WCT18_00755 [Patescibacteria group bacterium]
MQFSFDTEQEVLEIVLQSNKLAKESLVPITADCSDEVKKRWPESAEYFENFTKTEDEDYFNCRFYELPVTPGKVFTGHYILIRTMQERKTGKYHGYEVRKTFKDGHTVIAGFAGPIRQRSTTRRVS